MTERPEELTKISGRGRDEVYVGFGEFVPTGWEWTTDPSRGWHPGRITDDMKSVIVMCRARRKFWNVEVRDDGQVEIFGGGMLAACLHTSDAQSLADRIAAFLNGQDEHQQLIYAIADAQSNTGQNMLPIIQECAKLAKRTRSRIESYG